MKLLLADDHPLFLEGLQYLLETYGIETAGVANSGREALEKARLLRPDMILMDIKMPGMSGIDALKCIKAEMPEIKVVMLTTSDEDDDLFGAMRCGASGYLLKNTNAKALVGLLSELERGEMPLSPGLAARLLTEFGRGGGAKREAAGPDPAKRQSGVRLTPRQLEILELIAAGCTYRQAGERLGLTERTLKYHMGHIIELLHMENRSQVLAYAGQSGMIRKKEPGEI